jgi:hypothetical protein
VPQAGANLGSWGPGRRPGLHGIKRRQYIRTKYIPEYIATESAEGKQAQFSRTCLTSVLFADHSSAACVWEEERMMMEPNVDSDPFADPRVDDEPQFVVDSTLNVSRHASLTLGTDSLIVLGMSLLYVKTQLY